MPLVEIGRRSITDFGILDLNTLSHPIHGSLQNWTRLQIWSVQRGKQTNPYVNLEWNPDQGFLGRLTVSATADLGIQSTPILSDKGIRYETELIYEWQDTERVTNLLINCATQKILLSIQNLGTLLGASTVAFIPLPLPPSKRCPASMIRVNCQSDARLDIVVFAENGIALLTPPDAICSSMVPIPFADAVPSPLDPNNSSDPAPPPGQPPTPGSPPYDPISGDDGETPAAPPVPPPAGALCLRLEGMVRIVGLDAVERYVNIVSGAYPPGYTVGWEETGISASLNRPYFNIRVRGVDGSIIDEPITGCLLRQVTITPIQCPT